MNLNEYQTLAMRTNSETESERCLTLAALGLAGESGEFADEVKKHLFHGHPLDRERLQKELGDVLWYVASGCLALGVTLEEVAQANVDKLRARYPEGFDPERSRNRTDENQGDEL